VKVHVTQNENGAHIEESGQGAGGVTARRLRGGETIWKAGDSNLNITELKECSYKTTEFGRGVPKKRE